MIGGRFCPLRAWRTRRCGGPVDRVLLLILAAVLAYGLVRGVHRILGWGIF